MKITRGQIAITHSAFDLPLFTIQVGNNNKILTLSRVMDANARDMDSYLVANALREMANELDDN